MKKLLLAIVMAFTAVAGHAQTTFNIRAGGGFFQWTDSWDDKEYWTDSWGNKNYLSDYGSEKEILPGAAFILEANIGRRGKKFVFSPSALIASDFTETWLVEFPLLFGCKVPMGNRSLFIPKVGPMLGYETWNEKFMCGPSVELAFEIKHFIVAANLQEDLIEKNFGFFATVGYKF